MRWTGTLFRHLPIRGLAATVTSSWPIYFTPMGNVAAGTVYSSWKYLTAGPDCIGGFSVPAVEIGCSNNPASSADVYLELETTSLPIVTLHVKSLSTVLDSWSTDTWDPAADTFHVIAVGDCANVGVIYRARWRFSSSAHCTVSCLGSSLVRWV